jgi:hypothetical protein
MLEHKPAYPAIGQARARLIRLVCVRASKARSVHRPGRIEGKASRASKVTTNYSLHSARSLGDRVMGLLDRPAATKGGVGKVKDTLRATYGQGWPYRTGAVGAVASTDSLRGAFLLRAVPGQRSYATFSTRNRVRAVREDSSVCLPPGALLTPSKIADHSEPFFVQNRRKVSDLGAEVSHFGARCRRFGAEAPQGVAWADSP